MYITIERELDEPFTCKEIQRLYLMFEDEDEDEDVNPSLFKEVWIYISVYTEYDVHSINKYYQTSVTYEIDNIECCDKDGDTYTLSAKAREAFINHMDSGIKQQLQDFAEMNSDFTDEEIQDEIREAM